MNKIELAFGDAQRINLNGTTIDCVTPENACAIMQMQEQLQVALADLAKYKEVAGAGGMPEFTPISNPPPLHKIVVVKYDSGVISQSWLEGDDQCSSFDNNHGDVISWRDLLPGEAVDETTEEQFNKMLKDVAQATLQSECDAFNNLVEIGGDVLVRIDGQRGLMETKTKSAAQILSGHTAVVWLEGVSGCYLLSHVVQAPGPTVHYFSSNYHAHLAATTVNEPPVNHGDVLVVKSEELVAIVAEPIVAITRQTGIFKPLSKTNDHFQVKNLISIAKAQGVSDELGFK